jgi:hypothetical protein
VKWRPTVADDTTNERRLRESVERLEAVTPRYTPDDATLIGPDGFTRLVERRAEEAEFHVEQLRDARDSAERIGERAAELATERDAALARIARAERLIDSWEHDAPDHSNPAFIGRLRECLRRDPAPVRLREGAVPERQVGSFEDMHPERCPMTEHSPPEAGCDSECTGLCGEHHWLDRPESDTRECLICGTEVAG